MPSHNESVQILRKFREYCGDQRFNKFVATLNTRCREKRRLLAWQEVLWNDFCQSSGILVPDTWSQVGEVFEMGTFEGKVFRRLTCSCESEVYACDDEPDLRIELTHHYNHFVSGSGRQLSATDWRVLRGDRVVYRGTEDVPIGDWMSRPRSWREQVEARIGTIRIRDDSEA